MRFLLEDKAVQAGRIFLLLFAAAVLGEGIWIAFNLTVLSPLPIWIGNGVIIMLVVYIMVITD